jgi:hypothetical protein
MRTKFWSENLKGRELGRPRLRVEDDIKMVLRETGCSGVTGCI